MKPLAHLHKLLPTQAPPHAVDWINTKAEHQTGTITDHRKKNYDSPACWKVDSEGQLGINHKNGPRL